MKQAYRLQSLDKPILLHCKCRTSCKFAAISHNISQTVQASAKVTTECEYEVVCTLQNDVISNNHE